MLWFTSFYEILALCYNPQNPIFHSDNSPTVRLSYTQSLIKDIAHLARSVWRSDVSLEFVELKL